jgi:hypothetical protein
LDDAAAFLPGCAGPPLLLALPPAELPPLLLLSVALVLVLLAVAPLALLLALLLRMGVMAAAAPLWPPLPLLTAMPPLLVVCSAVMMRCILVSLTLAS